MKNWQKEFAVAAPAAVALVVVVTLAVQKWLGENAGWGVLAGMVLHMAIGEAGVAIRKHRIQEERSGE